jgi:hypothetical protein
LERVPLLDVHSLVGALDVELRALDLFDRSHLLNVVAALALADLAP